MIRKFATVTRVQFVRGMFLATILAGAAAVQAQQEPAPPAAPPTQSQPPAQPQQPSDQQSSSSQEPSDEIGMRKPKPKEFNDWSFNVGGGASLTSGATKNFVRGGGGIAAAGVARNANKYLGLRLDFQFDNLPLRASALQSAGSTGGHAQAYTFMLGPVINIPVNKDWSAYIIGGFVYLHRTGELNNSTAIPGYPCNPFFNWWGHCFNGSLPIYNQFLRASQNEIGEDFGGGIARKIRPNMEIYAEWRIVHASHNGITTDLRPITAGIRW